MRKKVKSKTPMDTPGLYAVTYEDNSIGYEMIPSGKAGEPVLPMDIKSEPAQEVKDVPFYRSVKDAIREHKTPMLEIGKHITKDDALRFAKESKKISNSYRAMLIKEIEEGLVKSINFNEDEEEEIPDSPKGGSF